MNTTYLKFKFIGYMGLIIIGTVISQNPKEFYDVAGAFLILISGSALLANVDVAIEDAIKKGRVEGMNHYKNTLKNEKLRG